MLLPRDVCHGVLVQGGPGGQLTEARLTALKPEGAAGLPRTSTRRGGPHLSNRTAKLGQAPLPHLTSGANRRETRVAIQNNEPQQPATARSRSNPHTMASEDPFDSALYDPPPSPPHGHIAHEGPYSKSPSPKQLPFSFSRNAHANQALRSPGTSSAASTPSTRQPTSTLSSPSPPT